MKFLFVCSRNRLRSPTAEAIFSSYEGVEAISAGTNNDAPTPVSADLIDWADVVFCMEDVHRSKLMNRYKPLFKTKKLVALGIADNYQYMDAELVRILKAKLRRYVEANI